RNPKALESRLMPLFTRLSVFAAIVPFSLAFFLWLMVAVTAWLQLPETRGLLIGGVPAALVGGLTFCFAPDILYKGYCWVYRLWSQKHPGESRPGAGRAS
ncbi:MAG TPA: hypothetical protein PLG06_01520, partial [Anaerolineae bacterium]|nr:hypothetical protein [Anaerolineae bacterium]